MVTNDILQEIWEIPDRAGDFLKSPSFSLPCKAPYLGMGSSYFAALAFKYLGIEIEPEIASEYFNYSVNNKPRPLGVILSQSGRSSEALWNIPLFERFIAITNDTDSPLARAANATQIIPLMAGRELYSSSKTYVNTLLALFKGFGFTIENVVELLKRKMPVYASQGETLANAIFEILSQQPIHGIYVLGNGANIATAYEAALILSESVKRPFHGMSMAQYDHGPKETAKSTIVVVILSQGKTRERSLKLADTITRAGGRVITLGEEELPEASSIISNIIPFNFMAFYLAQKMGVQADFVVGSKVTEACQ